MTHQHKEGKPKQVPSFEYDLLFIGDANNLLRSLNTYGQKGWHAVAYIPGAGVLLERPLPDARA